jgi:hypothetical protein
MMQSCSPVASLTTVVKPILQDTLSSVVWGPPGQKKPGPHCRHSASDPVFTTAYVPAGQVMMHSSTDVAVSTPAVVKLAGHCAVMMVGGGEGKREREKEGVRG